VKYLLRLRTANFHDLLIIIYHTKLIPKILLIRRNRAHKPQTPCCRSEDQLLTSNTSGKYH